MAIPMNEIRSRFIRYDEGATFARDDNLRFMDYGAHPRNYSRVNMGQLGYNANNPSVRVRTIRLSRDPVISPRR